MIAYYNENKAPQGVDKLPLLMHTLLVRRINMRGFIINLEYGSRFGEFFRAMSGWGAEGKIKDREDIVEGFENAPGSFIGMLERRNFGKLIVRLAE